MEDVWNLIALYIPAHPQRYVRLAGVNITFYRIFMSDKLWSKLDFYDVKEGGLPAHYLMRSHYLSTKEKRFLRCVAPKAKGRGRNRFEKYDNCSREDYYHNCSTCGRYKRYSADCCFCDNCSKISGINRSTNIYVTFMVVANDHWTVPHSRLSRSIEEKAKRLLVQENGLLEYASGTHLEDLNLVKTAIVLNPKSLKYVPKSHTNYNELACLAVRRDPSVYTFKGLSGDGRHSINQTFLKAQRQLNGVDSLCDLLYIESQLRDVSLSKGKS